MSAIIQANLWPTIIMIVILVVGYKMLVNQIRLVRIQRYYQQYQEYLESKKDSDFILQRKSDIVQLFKGAGLKDSNIPFDQIISPLTITRGHASAWDNMITAQDSFTRVMYIHFNEAIGFYRSRRNEALSPLYWIDLVVNLPRSFLGYLGLPSESIVVKITQIVYWLATLAVAAVTLYDRFLKS